MLSMRLSYMEKSSCHSLSEKKKFQVQNSICCEWPFVQKGESEYIFCLNVHKLFLDGKPKKERKNKKAYA